MGDVVYNTGIITKLDIPPERILKSAMENGKLKSVVILGWDEDGEDYFASSLADAAEVIFLLELAKYQLVKKVNDREFREREEPPDGCA